MNKKPGLTYASAGVDIDAGNDLVRQIKPLVKSTQRPGVLGSIGGFGGLFELPGGYQQPVLVSATDGVGTKLVMAMQLGVHDTVGIDLVAMCVNDVVVTGAEPLFFLDYYATGKLHVELARSVIQGIATGCQYAGAALIGGETAELPGMYSGEDYDLAGFCVGIVEKTRILNPESVQAGDKVIGLASSGPHSNGYSLIRKILKVSGCNPDEPFADGTLATTLMAPTRIYVRPLLAVLENHSIRSMAHITGGGIVENLPRALPDHLQARLVSNAWPVPEIFTWLQQHGDVDWQEMLRTFNCGLGMILVVPESESRGVLETLNQSQEQAFVIGDIQPGDKNVVWDS